MDTLIVTGGAGYIGSHTIIELLENTDFRIVSIDNFSNSTPDAFERIQKITGKEVKNYNADISSTSEMSVVFEKEKNIAGVIHFAAFKSVPESVTDPLKYYYNNVIGLTNLLNLCSKYNVHKFIFSSSCSVYGNVSQLPVKENTPFNKVQSPYAYTKQIGEELLKDFAVANPFFKCIVLRYFNPVGAHLSGLIGESPLNKPASLFPVITQTAAGKIKNMSVFGDDYETRDGSCIRDYVHVTDIANAHVKAFQRLSAITHRPGSFVYNLGSGNGVSVFEAIHAFEKIAKKDLNYRVEKKRAGDIAAIYSDSSLAALELGWFPRLTLDEMMESAWKWELQSWTTQQHRSSNRNSSTRKLLR